MAKSPNQSEPDVATRIMERMVRMPPKPHKEMKLGKRKSKESQKEKASRSKGSGDKKRNIFS
jgi:hypothetical protein